MIFVILGPTASGKTSLADTLAKKYPNLVLVNADAFQIYKDMDVGTAKIRKDDPLKERYLLMDIINPSETYSVKQYKDDFNRLVVPLIKQGKDILIVGGTGLYVRAALYDYEFLEEEETKNETYDHLTNDDLYKILNELDPLEATKIHKNNRKRVIRAINLIKNSGESKSEMLKRQEHKIIFNDVFIYCLDLPRDELLERISLRTKEIIKDGLINEAKYLKNTYDLSLTSQQAIGYKEAFEYINGDISISEMEERINIRTRQYAKRQMTFFKHQFSLLPYGDKISILSDIEKEITKHGQN